MNLKKFIQLFQICLFKFYEKMLSKSFMCKKVIRAFQNYIHYDLDQINIFFKIPACE